MNPHSFKSPPEFSNATFKPKTTTSADFADLFRYGNASLEPGGDPSPAEVDINERYYLNVIVPVVWSMIIFLGILGKQNKIL